MFVVVVFTGVVGFSVVVAAAVDVFNTVVVVDIIVIC